MIAAISGVVVAKVVVPVVALVGPLLTLFGLPGTWLALVVAGLFEWRTETRLFSTWTIVGVLVLAVLGEVWEFTASASRAKKAGAGRRGTLGALGGGILGAILGTIVMPVVGTIIGGGAGALIASASLERSGGKSVDEALAIGRAAATGQVLGVAGKLVLALMVWVWLTVAVLV